MVLSFFVSLLAFVIVPTTTLIIVNNRAKVNKMKKLSYENKQKNDMTNFHQDKKMKHLVDKINDNNVKITNKHNKLDRKIDNVDKKTNTRVTNLNNRFNSYKNITTANFMGMNNRMTREINRIDDNHDRLKHKVDQHKSERIEEDAKLQQQITDNHNSFNNFVEKDYKNFVNNTFATFKNDTNDNFNKFDNKLKQNHDDVMGVIEGKVFAQLNSLNETDLNTIHTLSNLVVEKVNYLNRDIEEKLVGNLNKNNFEDYYLQKYFTNPNIPDMNSLINIADQNNVNITSLDEEVKNVKDKVNLNESSINSIYTDNINKTNFQNWFYDQYNMNTDSSDKIRSDITLNETNLGVLSNRVDSMSNVLNSIGVVNSDGSSTLNLQDLSDNIDSNLKKINNITVNKVSYDDFDKAFQNNLTDETFKLRFDSQLTKDRILNEISGEDLFNKMNTTTDPETKFGNTEITGSLTVNGTTFKSIKDMAETNKTDANMTKGILNTTFSYLGDRDDIIPYEYISNDANTLTPDKILLNKKLVSRSDVKIKDANLTLEPTASGQDFVNTGHLTVNDFSKIRYFDASDNYKEKNLQSKLTELENVRNTGLSKDKLINTLNDGSDLRLNYLKTGNENIHDSAALENQTIQQRLHLLEQGNKTINDELLNIKQPEQSLTIEEVRNTLNTVNTNLQLGTQIDPKDLSVYGNINMNRSGSSGGSVYLPNGSDIYVNNERYSDKFALKEHSHPEMSGVPTEYVKNIKYDSKNQEYNIYDQDNNINTSIAIPHDMVTDISVDNNKLVVKKDTLPFGKLIDLPSVPSKYVTSIEFNDDENSYSVVNEGSPNIDNKKLPSPTKQDILSKVNDNIDSERLNVNTLKIGGRCLKTNAQGNLMICDSGCSSCATIWDTSQAPDPNS
jgi:hypothetical protein